jgi:hypothetical protein
MELEFLHTRQPLRRISLRFLVATEKKNYTIEWAKKMERSAWKKALFLLLPKNVIYMYRHCPNKQTLEHIIPQIAPHFTKDGYLYGSKQ